MSRSKNLRRLVTYVPEDTYRILREVAATEERTISVVAKRALVERYHTRQESPGNRVSPARAQAPADPLAASGYGPNQVGQQVKTTHVVDPKVGGTVKGSRRQARPDPKGRK